MGMGFTRDPYMNVGLNNFWVNIGDEQIHIPTRPSQVLPGHVGVVVPNLAGLAQRLESVKELLAGTKFSIRGQGRPRRRGQPVGQRVPRL